MYSCSFASPKSLLVEEAVDEGGVAQVVAEEALRHAPFAPTVVENYLVAKPGDATQETRGRYPGYCLNAARDAVG